MTIIQTAEQYYNQAMGVHMAVKQGNLYDNIEVIKLYDSLMDKAKFYLELAKK